MEKLIKMVWLSGFGLIVEDIMPNNIIKLKISNGKYFKDLNKFSINSTKLNIHIPKNKLLHFYTIIVYIVDDKIKYAINDMFKKTNFNNILLLYEIEVHVVNFKIINIDNIAENIEDHRK